MGRFDHLSPRDFEVLIADLMTATTGIRYRVGTAGPDGGIDLLAEDEAGLHVVQCKHLRDSNHRALVREARREAKKLAGRDARFASYRFVTSLRLNHEQQREVAGILDPWIGSASDVFGEHDLTRLLAEHSAVEQRHVKLWLPSAAALRRALSARAYERSRALLDDVRADLSLYVQTDAFHRARAVLEAESVCIIAGPAGIGKTTLARMLVLDALKDGYQPFEIVKGSLADAWETLELEGPQIYLFDDFLGETFLDSGRADDADLVRFIRRVVRKPDARLVLATREYIRRDARRMSELLARKLDPAHHVLIDLPALTRDDRARIFYNHVWFSPHLDAVARASLLLRRGYLRVVDHPSFSPRVIEWICGLGAKQLTGDQRHDFAAFCVDTLSHPQDMWEHAFRQGIGGAERALLLAMPGLPHRVELDVLEQAFDASCRARGEDLRGGRFQSALRVLEDSFLTTARSETGILVSPANPSLLDFLQREITRNAHDVRAAIDGAAYFEQVVWIFQALRRSDGEVDPELQADLASGFCRTFNSAPMEKDRKYSLTELASGELLVDAGDRFDFLLLRAARSHRFHEALLTWLPERAEAWVRSLSTTQLFFWQALGTVRALVEFGALDPRSAAADVLRIVDGNGNPFSELHEYEVLIGVRSFAPELFQARLPVARERFAAFADRALRELGRFIDDAEDLAALMSVADDLEVPLDRDLVADAQDWVDGIEEEEEAESWRGDRWDGEVRASWSSPVSSAMPDADVDALFQGLAD